MLIKSLIIYTIAYLSEIFFLSELLLLMVNLKLNFLTLFLLLLLLRLSLYILVLPQKPKLLIPTSFTGLETILRPLFSLLELQLISLMLHLRLLVYLPNPMT
ncbi:hypothetical protein BD560DRAFT_177426 [Blakeslea trispora]|nr:hypothetical protein BD560DRAFT_177426 [Blakeslea trispora]